MEPANGRFDVDFARGWFPALAPPAPRTGGWGLFDNAGGSVVARPVVEAVSDYLSILGVQLGASYEASQEAVRRIEAGHRAAERLLGADRGEVIVGSSTTVNLRHLAASLRSLWQAGDEVVVTNLDHESNIGPWRALEQSGIVVREWRLRPETAKLELSDLEALLGPRTKLVAFTHCSNLVGRIHDVAAIVRTIHRAGALACVDGVAFAPHRRVDVKALGADFYSVSLYKTYGPHQGLLYGRRELLERARGCNHEFIPEDDVPYKFQPGGVVHELAAAIPGICEYLAALDLHHFGSSDLALGGRLERVFGLIAEHEERLVAPLLDFLTRRHGVHLLGPATADRRRRVPTVSFWLDGQKSSEIPPLLDAHRLAVRWGHFYARRAIRDLGLDERDGIVRISLVHYNTPAEVERLIEVLDQVLPTQ